ncbi:MAG: M48 family metalloprotease [Akkermansiaceae bacterium]|nr:M48 family metalloprotease [Armatimonadota bacterium]
MSETNSQTEIAADNIETTATPTGRVRFPQIAPDTYRHPLDQQATAALRAVPGFELVASKFSQYSFEKIIYHEECASAVRVTPKQLPRIHALLREACTILDLPEPSLFVSQTPIANAFALGRDNPTMVLHTGLVELLSEDELLAVIAHEMGHIHCGHTVYRLMALMLQLLAKLGDLRLGMGDLFSFPIRAALLEWTRKAEFSADRAAIIVVQDPEVVFSALFKLTGGSPKIFEQMDREEYLKQAEDYERPDWSRLDKFYKVMLESDKTHPIPVLRAKEVLRWGATDEYKNIIAGSYIFRDKVGDRRRGPLSTISMKTLANERLTCPSCGKETDAAFTFCINCGTVLKPDLASDQDAANSEGSAPLE